jgi:hypothetical protein
MNITLAQQIKCVEREIFFRKKCYDRFVLENKIESFEKANYELKAMNAVLETLKLIKLIGEGNSAIM